MRFTVITLPRVIVDPNSVSRKDPQLSVASFSDADRLPEVGATVFAVQPDEDGPDFVGTGVVTEIDRTYQLIIVRVDWSTFREEAPAFTRRNDQASQVREVHWAEETVAAFNDGSAPIRRLAYA